MGIKFPYYLVYFKALNLKATQEGIYMISILFSLFQSVFLHVFRLFTLPISILFSLFQSPEKK